MQRRCGHAGEGPVADVAAWISAWTCRADTPDEERERTEADRDPHREHRVDQQRIDEAAARDIRPGLDIEAQRDECDRLEDADDCSRSA